MSTRRRAWIRPPTAVRSSACKPGTAAAACSCASSDTSGGYTGKLCVRVDGVFRRGGTRDARQIRLSSRCAERPLTATASIGAPAAAPSPPRPDAGCMYIECCAGRACVRPLDRPPDGRPDEAGPLRRRVQCMCTQPEWGVGLGGGSGKTKQNKTKQQQRSRPICSTNEGGGGELVSW